MNEQFEIPLRINKVSTKMICSLIRTIKDYDDLSKIYVTVTSIKNVKISALNYSWILKWSKPFTK